MGSVLTRFTMIGGRSVSLVLSRPIDAVLEPFDARDPPALTRISVVRPITHLADGHDLRLPGRQHQRTSPPVQPPEPEQIAIIDTVHSESGVEQLAEVLPSQPGRPQPPGR